MLKPFFFILGQRYSKVRNQEHFIAFISLTSIIGIAVGVTVLITVLSVMNGFRKEIRNEMLAAAPHITIRSITGDLREWPDLVKYFKKNPKVLGAAPYVIGQGMITGYNQSQGVYLRGIDPSEINDVINLKNNMVEGTLESLKDKSYSMLIGTSLAKELNLLLGDKVTVMVPKATITPAGMIPRLRRFTVSGIFDASHYYNTSSAFVHLEDAKRMLQIKEGISGIQLRVEDELEAPMIANQIANELKGAYWVFDWTQQFESFFKSIQMEKTVMTVILFLIVVVAAFNLVSSLVTMVAGKKADIAILRTMGATQAQIMHVFMAQGIIIGVFGTILGLIFGLLLAHNVPMIVDAIQRLFHVQFIVKEVYGISFVPSEVHTTDVILVCAGALLISFLATLYPSKKAASIQPAEGLRYE